MESERDFANLVHEFQHEITKAQNNLQLFDKIVSTNQLATFEQWLVNAFCDL